MSKKLSIKEYLVFILGAFVMGVGIAFCNYANLGVDSMSVLVLGVSRIADTTFGTMNFIFAIAMMFVGLFTERKNVTIATIISMGVVSLGIDSFLLFDLPEVTLVASYICLVIGMILYTAGIAISQVAGCGLTAYDCMVFGFMKMFKQKYHVIRWAVEIISLVLGIMLKGTFGVCTVAIILFAGKMVEFFVEKFEKLKK